MSIIKGTNQIVAGFGGTKRPLGEVYFSQSSLATDNPGALPGWTGEYYENGKTLFPDLYNFVKAHSELQVTKTQYDNAIATYGECPKYVIGGGSLRLPKLSNYIKAANTADGIKNIEAGLPDHKHLLTNTTSDLYTHYGTTNIYSVRDNGQYTNQARGKIGYASESNPIYGKSSTVTPASTTLYPWVVAYTAAIPASTAQAAEFQQGLSGKADTNLGNLSAAGKSLASGLGMPSDRYTIFEVGASGAIYTMPFSGYVSVFFNTTSNFSYCHLYNVGTNSGFTLTYYSSGLNGLKMMLPVKKDKTFAISYGGLTFTSSILVKAEGEE